MTETTTPEATAPGRPVVSPASSLDLFRSAADRFRQDEDAIRKALAPTERLADSITREVGRMESTSQRITRQVSATAEALEALSRHLGRDHGRAGALARLTRKGRRITRGNARLSVSVARYLSDLTGSGRVITADLAARALEGDAEARREWQDLADLGDPDAATVLGFLADLGRMQAEADALAADTAALVASVGLADLPETAEPVAPPRITLAGSLDLNAPPVAAWSATAGNVRPARRSPMP